MNSNEYGLDFDAILMIKSTMKDVKKTKTGSKKIIIYYINKFDYKSEP
jgi:hypothetical protein